MIKTPVLALLLLFALCTAGFSQSKEVLQKIHEVETHLAGWVQTQHDHTWTLSERMAHYHLKGVSIAVVNDYKIEWAKGYGWADSSEGRHVTTSTLFQAASISKSLNAMGVLKLVQDGKLNLHMDVNRYLKHWKLTYNTLTKGKKITMAHLLSHTAGLSVHGFPGYDIQDSIPSIEQILDGRRPANSPRVYSMFEPGLRSQYSGGGITLSQLVVMNITGLPYDRYMHDSILLPLGMTASFYTQPPGPGKRALLATGYKNNGAAIHGKYHIYPEQAAAGLWTNPTDLCRFIIASQLSLEGKQGGVLSPAMTRTGLTPYIDSNAALGVFIQQRGPGKYFSHGGANEGFRSQYFGSLHGGKGVVVMVNSDNGAIMDEIINSVATVYKWEGFYAPVVKKEIDAPAALEEYAGRYIVGGDTVHIIQRDGRLFLDVRFDQWQLHFTSPDDFFLYDDHSDLQFIRDNGRIVGLLIDHKQRAKKITAIPVNNK
ncbi:serine hydrolase domain-containing protein [Flavitalea sp. BT771]|uniref:serine hydrolase domain-containing protein n=1 Tax=Flavitalea sp. BT771 TaxID=3063329 RepID=UPI0026E3E6E7|nr:serine hydrolase domain-containing protein [Flavitalea sp. BT771]MDO6435466.1 serine hydrolase domain-containing protein [Flavitalea sp. BT771]MDV6224366.1 serine hydrolase domain-containing protein [Flavitalea sp. BT771]